MFGKREDQGGGGGTFSITGAHTGADGGVVDGCGDSDNVGESDDAGDASIESSALSSCSILLMPGGDAASSRVEHLGKKLLKLADAG